MSRDTRRHLPAGPRLAMAVLGPAAAAEPIELTQSVADLVAAGGEVDYGNYSDFGADGPHRISVAVRLAHLLQ